MHATPAPAATLILLRDGEISPEVLMLERHARSDFLPDMYVFPGGRVEEQDRKLADRVTGVDAVSAAARIGTVPPDQALGFFVAAIRETFEECGVLLARRRGHSELLDADRAHRHSLGSGCSTWNCSGRWSLGNGHSLDNWRFHFRFRRSNLFEQPVRVYAGCTG